MFCDYAEHRRHYGDVSVLPTSVFFHGWQEGQDISIDIDQGKTLVLRMQGQTEAVDDGQTKIFFELNGQPRLMRIDRAGAVKAISHPQAEKGNARYLGAPMPGMVVTVAAKDLLLEWVA